VQAMVGGMRAWLQSHIVDRFGASQREFSRLALIAKSTSDAVNIIDRDGRIEWVNEGFTRLTGYTAEEAIGRRPGEFLRSDETNPADAQAIDAAFRAGTSVRREIVNRSKTGRHYWIDVEAQPLRGPDGVVTGYMTIASDITQSKALQNALTNRNLDLEMMSTLAGVGAWRYDLDGERLWLSAQVYDLLDLDPTAGPSIADCLKLVLPDRRQHLRDLVTSTLDSGTSWDEELRVVTPKGHTVWVRAMCRPLMIEGQIRGLIGAIQDITAIVGSRETIRLTQERLELATTSARVGLWDWHAADEMTWVNPEWWGSLGYDAHQMHGLISATDEPVHPDDFARVTSTWLAFIAGETDEFSCEYRILDGLGQWRWIQSVGRTTRRDAKGNIERVSGVFTDIDQRKRADEQRMRDQERLWLLANMDTLTHIPNRGLFFGGLQDKIDEAEGQALVVGIVDLDRFKEVNDSFGHAIGDELLVKIAERLKMAIGPNDVVARLSGDEFAFLLTDIGDGTATEARISQLLAAVCEPIALSNRVKRGGGSLGWASYPQDAATATELLRCADIALYAAKTSGRRTARAFDPSMEAEVNAGRDIRHDFEAALENHEIVAFYQPVVSADQTELRGFEALARWNHKTRGILGTAHFLSALKEPELARSLGTQMRTMVLAQMTQWRAQNIAFGRVAINAVAADFEGELVSDLLSAIESGALRPEDLCIEVTEGVLLDGAGNARILEGMMALKHAGVEIAFDDFGTGYASLSHLREYPIDRLKIDCSFVGGLPSSARDLEIVRTIGTLASALGLRLTAEGVETEEQAGIVAGLGATDLQGHLFAESLPGENVPGFIAGFEAHVRGQTLSQPETMQSLRRPA
jgi:diguanylate cyclase (GGDEF)-like protein/PAS domain S-box-containing protein